MIESKKVMNLLAPTEWRFYLPYEELKFAHIQKVYKVPLCMCRGTTLLFFYSQPLLEAKNHAGLFVYSLCSIASIRIRTNFVATVVNTKVFHTLN